MKKLLFILLFCIMIATQCNATYVEDKSYIVLHNMRVMAIIFTFILLIALSILSLVKKIRKTRIQVDKNSY